MRREGGTGFLFGSFSFNRLAASWAARLEVSVGCLAIVVLTRLVRVVFLGLGCGWLLVLVSPEVYKTFWCLRSTVSQMANTSM